MKVNRRWVLIASSVLVLVFVPAAGCGKKQESGGGKTQADESEPKERGKGMSARARKERGTPQEEPASPSEQRRAPLVDISLPDVETKDVRCERQAKEFPGATGVRFVATCPAGCQEVGTVWGTDVYTDDSALCRALIHAGVMGKEGGRALVTFAQGQLAYRGSLRNGIQSTAYASWERSFFAQRIGPQGKPLGAPPKVTDKNSAALDCAHAAGVLPGPDGTVFRVSCPQDCASGSVWGTNPYTADSSVCRAAIHAGLSTAKDGGSFTLTVAPGQDKYKGSEANGVTTSSFGEYDRSYRLSPLAKD
ncbi:MAG: LCCL domain-containing protein [Polyangia bacterium]|jgi:hypothetical protein|nr:LCCL domain-containing protein [Polyangia bacterium]